MRRRCQQMLCEWPKQKTTSSPNDLYYTGESAEHSIIDKAGASASCRCSFQMKIRQLCPNPKNQIQPRDIQESAPLPCHCNVVATIYLRLDKRTNRLHPTPPAMPPNHTQVIGNQGSGVSMSGAKVCVCDQLSPKLSLRTCSRWTQS